MTELDAALAHADESEDQAEIQGLLSASLAGTGDVWIAEAENLAAAGTSGTMLGGPPRAVWHTTEAPSGGDYFDAMHRVLTSKKAEPHILWDPLTDRMGQYFPLNRSARALRNHPEQSTNKTGAVCIQIEVVGYASKPFTSYWKPGPNFAALMRAIRSWGIPDAWPAGVMSTRGEDVSRSLATWRNEAGHYGHCHVPGNSHWDCGGIDQQAIFRTAPTAPAPRGFLMALTDAEQDEALDALRDLRRYIGTQAKPGNLATLIGQIPARVTTLVGRLIEGDNAAQAEAIAELVVANLDDGDLSVEKVKAAVRSVFADAATE